MDITMEEGAQGMTKEIGGKTKSDRVGQKMAPGNRNVTEVQPLTSTRKGMTLEPKNHGRRHGHWRKMAVLRDKQTQRSGVTRRQSIVNKVTKSPPARRGAGSSRRPRARGAGHRRPPALAGARVGMELPPQGVAKGLTPGFLPLHPGWGPTPKGKGGERSRGREGGKRLAAREAKQQPVLARPEGSICLCWGVGAISDLAAPLEGVQFRESESLRSERFGGRDLDAPALPAGNRCLWSWGGPGQWGELPAELGAGRGEAGPGLGWNLHFEKASGLVRGTPAGLLTSWQEGQAFGEGSDAPWGEGEPCGWGLEVAAVERHGRGSEHTPLI